MSPVDQDLALRLAAMNRSALTALQLRVATLRARREPRVLSRAWREEPFVAPSTANPMALRRAEVAVMESLAEWEFLDLSPAAPLGTCSAFSAGSQNRVLSANRDLEFQADPTNALALEIANRPRGDWRIGTCTRVVRTQRSSDPAHTQHFAILGLARSGRDPGGRTFERSALESHIEAMRAALRVFTDRSPEVQVFSTLNEVPGAPLEGAYYSGLRAQLWVGEHNLADGGLVDWLATLRSDRKERLFTSGFGLERALSLWG